MDEKSVQLYKEALQNGKEKIYNIRVMVVGQYGVGKTILTKRLLEQRVNLCERKSTEGIDVYKHCCKVSLDTGEWIVQHEDSDQLFRLQRLVGLLTSHTKEPEVSGEQDGHREDIKNRGTTLEDFSIDNDDNYDSDECYYNVDDDDQYNNEDDYNHHANDDDDERYDNDDNYNHFDNDDDDDRNENDENDDRYDNDPDDDRDDNVPDDDQYDNDDICCNDDNYYNDDDDENDGGDRPTNLESAPEDFSIDHNDNHEYDDSYYNEDANNYYNNDDDNDRYDNDDDNDRYDNDDDYYNNDNDYNDDYDNDDTYYNNDSYCNDDDDGITIIDLNVDILSNQPKQSDPRHATSQGDTTMEFLQLVNENAENLKKSMFEYALLTMWDFAGQYIFYTTHQTFLTRRAIYLLVTDLSRQVTDLVKDDECFFDAEGSRLCEVQDLVEVWMNSIHCCAISSAAGAIATPSSVTTAIPSAAVQSSASGIPSTSTASDMTVTTTESGITVTSASAGIALTSPGNSTDLTSLADAIQVTPPVILVGTHVDQIQEDKRDGITSMYFQQICRILKDKPTLKHLVDFIAIDNTRYDPQLKRLKDRIFQLASEQPYWGEEVPSSWLPLEEALMKLKASGKKVIPLCLVEELNRAASVPIRTAEELDLFLRFQHEIGTIMFFSAEGLREKIVLDPQWLIDALKSLITAEMFILMKYPAIRDKWFDFKDNGKLTTELIDAIWTKQQNPEFHDSKEHILHLMEKLNIVAKPRSYLDNQEELKEEDYYLAPCMLRQAMPKEIISPESNPQMESTSVLCFVSTGKFLPTPVFHRLIAACVSHWQIATKQQKALIFCGCCVFELDHHHRLTLYFKDYIIFAQVAIMGVKDMYKSSKLCSEARKFIIKNLREIVGTLGQSLQFEPHIKCPDSVADSLNGLIALSILQNNENVVCHSHDKSHILVSQELVKFWFENEEDSIGGSAAAGPVISPPSSDTDRFMCVAYLLVDIGSQVLRKLFLHHTVSSACTLDQYIANNRKSLDKLHSRNILSQMQMDILFPPSGASTSLENYDITLLSALFRNTVRTLNMKETKLIQSLRGDRNEIYGHASSCQMNISDYQMYWNRVSSTLNALCKQCGDPVFENDILLEIQRIQVTAIPAGSYLDILKTWFTRIETVENEVLEIKTRLEALELKSTSKSET
ncbi:hypothetical protein CHS0354_040568 [Potamilus streckersoni]|uniref:C-terminal of Roc (COR) domain-containing protein n=1 Tax=Potamilus streckersoni TaxID=2493646 RepID=A0AAE0VWJ2_9BIVA|nr:hypothetical protein CHS0354_040568 [Potamilus streckersoni]